MRVSAIALAAIIAVAAGCGGDDAGDEALTADEWRTRASSFCADGTQRATALPLPATRSSVAADAAKRAEIVTNVRDELTTLGQAEGIDAAEVEAYLARLGGDAELLRRISRVAAAGGDFQRLNGRLDESAGQAANALELPDCAAFANAIARTP